VDDGSTDGTTEAVAAMFPAVTVIRGDGSLFWCAGMRLAWQNAAVADPDFYFWLNDDTFLLPDCLATLLSVWDRSAAKGQDASIVVASCCDAVTGEHSYGGELALDKHPGRLTPLHPNPLLEQRCDTFNGNCVLVARAAFKRLGMMRPFQHAISDTDYGLRASRLGIPVLLAPGYHAECSRNPPDSSWSSRALPRRERWRNLVGRKGLPPRDWWSFLWEHAGARAFLYWPMPYVRVLIGL
jgi:GT2 family glycosyltransferase